MTFLSTPCAAVALPCNTVNVKQQCKHMRIALTVGVAVMSQGAVESLLHGRPKLRACVPIMTSAMRPIPCHPLART